MSQSILDTMLTAKRQAVEEAKQSASLEDLRKRARASRETRGLVAALQRAASSPALIAEIKQRSPSKGVLRERFDPVSIAQAYQEAGAHALSVVTDAPYFGGQLAFIRDVKQFTELPVLRKDFIFDPYQVYESVVAGADAILLIVAVLDQDTLYELHHLARSLGMDVLVEVHSEAELTNALGIQAELIGINHRDLHTLAMDMALAERLMRYMPEGVTAVAESGLATSADIRRMRAAGVRAVLVGEHFMVQPDIKLAVTSLMSWL